MQRVRWIHAEGPEGEIRRWPLGQGTLTVGRAPNPSHSLTVPWDRALSREHFTLSVEGDGLRVRCLPGASNPVFFEGKPSVEFLLSPNGHFVAGRTRFRYLQRTSREQPEPFQEFTLAHDLRRRLEEQRAAECLRALTTLLPALRRCDDPADVWPSVLSVVGSLVPTASALCVFEANESSQGSLVPVHGSTGSYAASRRLVNLCLSSSETAVHRFTQEADQEMTLVQGVGWALACPILVAPDERYVLYALGQEEGSTPELERALIDLLAETVTQHLIAGKANRIQAQVGQFFSPSLRDVVAAEGLSRLLQPQRRRVSVMFFDLRGFSKATERAEGDALDTILEYHSLITEIMTLATDCVFEQDGIVLDFAGDAVMAGWGAPARQDDHAVRAVTAACRIVERLHALELPFSTEKRLRCGVGLASGEVVAGQLGGKRQVKYGWMGAVVNQAARLEGLTKPFGVPILMTEELRSGLGDRFLLRKVGRVRPAGMDESLVLYEPVLPWESGGSGLSREQSLLYERALEQFTEGDMLATITSLREVPVEDPVARFLARQAYLYEEQGLPRPWTGCLEFRQK